MKSLLKFLGTTAVFAAAMGILESVVAYYLRLMYYPNGFYFPLTIMPSQVLTAEILREAITIIMLVAVAFIGGKSFFISCMIFLYLFGIWDIVYYIGLKFLLGWPPSCFTWDLLFLIPFPWDAPVLAPVICSVLFIVFSSLAITLHYKGIEVKFLWREALLFFAGLFIILFTFLSDYFYVICNAVTAPGFSASEKSANISAAISRFIPEKFNWGVFVAGAGVFIISFLLFLRRTIAHNRYPQRH